ncbi:ATP-binding protein [Streptomyces sp. NPDC059142]|uniref:ATP-binding protein n=1 Tax=Streptomyces sp. NPDC059142 TaxID=3346739 RepID=UPI0036BB9B74
MKSEISPAAASAGAATPAELGAPPVFSALLPLSRIRLSSSHRGARLARLLCGQQLDSWGVPRTVPASGAVSAIVAELAANAVTHGRSPGRDFEVRLGLGEERVRVEVIDTRPDRVPRVPGAFPAPAAESTGGRGLLLVAAYADRWGWCVRDPYTKTVWAEVRYRAPGECQEEGQALSAMVMDT